ncbi:MAG: zinc metalloprotease HtpX [Pseudomonadota bacterium]
MNHAKTVMLLAGLTGLFMVAGFALGGEAGALIALAIAAAMNLWAFWGSDKAVLSRYRAQPVTAASAPDLHAMTAELARRADLPMPALYIIEEAQPNAFATGRSPENAAVAVTTGLMRALPRDELAGVIAHELAHIKNRDTLSMTVAATLGGAIGFLAQFGLFFGGGRDRGALGVVGMLAAAILAPMAAMLIQMLISRTREYAADKMAAQITGQPMALASALSRIAGGGRAVEMHAAERDPSSAHMFIINPLAGRGVDSLFSTHPATENRIAALRAMAGQPAAAPRSATPAPARPVKRTRSRIPRAGRGFKSPWS